MGLLDEAIREHLELKRRRGGDPTEIERLEREALGPVRRVGQEPAAEPVGSEPPEALEHSSVSDELHEGAQLGQGGEYEEEPEYDYGPAHDAEYDVEEPEAAEERSPYAAGSERVPAGEPETSHSAAPPDPVPAGEPAHEPAASERPVYHDPGVETAEYDVEAAHVKEAEGEDVLEETPEFLQDAPDHDRLWFEQRPPKDFDFDG